MAISHAMWRLASARTSPLWPQPEVHAVVTASGTLPEAVLHAEASLAPQPT